MSGDKQLHEALERLDNELDTNLARIDRNGSLAFSGMIVALLFLTARDPGFAPGLGLVSALSIFRGIEVRRYRTRRAAARAYYRLTGERMLPE